MTSPAGASRTPGPPAPASGSPTGASASPPAAAGYDTLITIAVTGRTVMPTPGRVSVGVGDRIRLVLTTSKPNVLHIHGVDLEQPVRANSPTTVNFTIDTPGVYDAELHEPELLLTQLVAR